jgi:hypothetical protein
VVSSLHIYTGEVATAAAGDAITLTFNSNLDISRGDLVTKGDQRLRVGNEIEANLVWLADSPAEVGQRYFIKHLTRQSGAIINHINHRLNIGSLRHETASSLEINQIGSVHLRTSKPLAADNYVENRSTGSFILIDCITYATVAAGMITAIRDRSDVALPVSLEERIARQGHSGAIIELGGRIELAKTLERRLFDRGCNVCLFDNLPTETLHLLAGTGALILVFGSTTRGVLVLAQRDSVEATEQIPDGSDEDMRERIEQFLIRNSIVK